MKNFTFKTNKPAGRYRSFFQDEHVIKHNKHDIGIIVCSEYNQPPFQIKLRIMKTAEITDNNPNCPWKWITFKNKFTTFDEAKEWLKKNHDGIIEKYILVEK